MITKEMKEWLAAANDGATMLMQNDTLGNRSDINYIEVVNGVIVIHGDFKLKSAGGK
jgi:hypothetical protein